MKKLVMILVLGVSMASCTNTPTKVENPKVATTLELQQLASIDSLTYKVVEKDDTVYILSTEDNTVVKQVTNHTGALETLILGIFFMLIVLWVFLMIFSN